MTPKTFDELLDQIHIDAINGITFNRELYGKQAAKIAETMEAQTLKKLKDGLEFNHKFGGITGPQVMEALRDKIKELEGKK